MNIVYYSTKQIQTKEFTADENAAADDEKALRRVKAQVERGDVGCVAEDDLQKLTTLASVVSGRPVRTV